jgi:hypothetical protein
MTKSKTRSSINAPRNSPVMKARKPMKEVKATAPPLRTTAQTLCRICNDYYSADLANCPNCAGVDVEFEPEWISDCNKCGKRMVAVCGPCASLEQQAKKKSQLKLSLQKFEESIDFLKSERARIKYQLRDLGENVEFVDSDTE